MHWAEIICAIQKAGSTLTEIANTEGVSRSHVSLVVKGERTSHKVAYAISAVTGLTTEKMWPGKYRKPPSSNQPHLKEVANG